MIKPRGYQQDIFDAVRGEMRQHKSVLLQLPTGGGKTVIAAYMAENAVAKGGRVFFICHRRELLEQTSRTFSEFGISHGFIAAGLPKNYYSQVQICSIDTLKNRYEKVPVPRPC